MSWITHAGSSLPADSHNVTVKTSAASASTIVFAKNGSTTIRQIETIETTDYRGLDMASALAKVGVSDQTVQTKYYATIGGEQYSITLLSGTKTEVTAQRANDANGWTVTKRVTTYSSSPAASATDFTNVWKTTVSASSATGTVESYEMSRSHCRTCGDGHTLYSTKAVTVTEYRNLTQSAASSLVSSSTADTVVETRIFFQSYVNLSTSTQGSGSYSWVNSAWYVLPVGTERRASMRNAGDGAYNVTVTETVHGWACTPNSSTQRWTT